MTGTTAEVIALLLLAAVLSLDATVVLLTPVVFGTAARLRLRAKPHVYACTHLANSASTLLPVSNLTNLLAFGASGLSFLGFAALMTGPWLASLAVEFLAFRRFFATDLVGSVEPPDPPTTGTPRFALAVLALTLAGFAASSFTGIPPVVVAVSGAALLASKALGRREISPRQLVREASPLFGLFVLALGVVVAGVHHPRAGCRTGRGAPIRPDAARAARGGRAGRRALQRHQQPAGHAGAARRPGAGTAPWAGVGRFARGEHRADSARVPLARSAHRARLSRRRHCGAVARLGGRARMAAMTAGPVVTRLTQASSGSHRHRRR